MVDSAWVAQRNLSRRLVSGPWTLIQVGGSHPQRMIRWLQPDHEERRTLGAGFLLTVERPTLDRSSARRDREVPRGAVDRAQPQAQGARSDQNRPGDEQDRGTAERVVGPAHDGLRYRDRRTDHPEREQGGGPLEPVQHEAGQGGG